MLTYAAARTQEPAASDIGAYEFVLASPGIAASVPAPATHSATPVAAIDEGWADHRPP